jgi:DNA helicase-2/ATP-dependent DNA helicase PcrA
VGRDSREGAAGGVIRAGSGRRRDAKSSDGETKTRRSAEPIVCRVCSRSLLDAVERKLGRCEGCPSNLDPATYDALREWRSSRAKEQSLPAYCVFTDATLIAIGEARPETLAALAGISGVGKAKLERYGAEVLELLKVGAGGEELAQEVDDEG